MDRRSGHAGAPVPAISWLMIVNSVALYGRSSAFVNGSRPATNAASCRTRAASGSLGRSPSSQLFSPPTATRLKSFSPVPKRM
ncbi:MAG: hypothetical protein U0470_06685 [Anaerolineae bacterium]